MRPNRRPHRSLHLPLAAALLLALPAAAFAATRPAVKVEVRGIRGAQRHNVLSSLSIQKERRDKRLTTGRIQSLHHQAPDEIRQSLEPYGYYQPIIETALTQSGTRWRAVYTVDPGPPIRLTDVQVRISGEGAADPRFQRLVEHFPLRAGDALSHPEYETGKLGIAELGARAGFLDAEFDTNQIQVDLASYTSRIRLHFETGPRYAFGPVTFHQDVLHPGFLDSYVPFRRGETFDAAKLLQLQVALGSSPYFSHVEVEPRREDAKGLEVPIEVTLVPSKPRRYTAGLGFGTDDGPHGRLGTEFRRINRNGHRAEIDLRGARIEQSASAQYMIPWNNPYTDLLTLSAGYADLRPTTSRSQAGRLGAGLTRMLGSWQTAVSLTWQREKFTVGPDSGLVDLLIPETSWMQLSADNRVRPVRGHRLRLLARGATKTVLSDVAFAQGLVEDKVITTVANRNRLLVRAQVGALSASDFRELPPTLRFFAGGAQSVRGFAYNGLGPTDPATGRVIGGRYLLVGSGEYEFRLSRLWGIAAFYDVGNAVMSFRDRIEQGVGLGLRWMSPLGPVRADGAFGVSRPGTPFHVHLSVGPEL